MRNTNLIYYILYYNSYGSEGVGLFVKNDILNTYEATILDTSIEGIIWVKLVNKHNMSIRWNICVCYLPPHGSSRPTDAANFLEELHAQIFTYQNEGEFIIMGDFNSRVGNKQDFIEGVDDLPMRDVVDTKENAYSDIFTEFLISANCVMLNGRDNVKDDFTYVSNRGSSVVDYVLVPHALLPLCNSFEVIRARTLYTDAGCNGSVDPIRANIPDHSFLKWIVNSPHESRREKDTANGEPNKCHVRYDLKNIPSDFMSGDILLRVQDVIHVLEEQHQTQETINEAYSAFSELVKSEMNDSIPHRNINHGAKFRNKHRPQKPWWHEGLSDIWHELCRAEKQWLKSPHHQKAQAKAAMKQGQKQFNREVQKAKRNHWYSQQEEMMNLCNDNDPHFWKKIGAIGIAQERSKTLPLEVLQTDGSVTNDIEKVKCKWYYSFQRLLNPEPSVINVLDSDLPTYPDPINGNEELNVDISLGEVVQALKLAKTGKAVDNLPTEVLNNKTCAQFMLHLFNVCFKTGCVPEIWGQGMITPILKDSSKEIRDPGNHRGITIAPAMYKLFCSVLNSRLSKYVSSNAYIVDEQNGYQKGKSTIDHLATLTNILETRKLQRKKTFVAYIDFSKAYDRVNRVLLWKKLENIGVTGHMLNCIKGIYSNVSSSVKLSHSVFTDWFSVGTGLRQGCILSPICFNLYINDMAMEIKSKCTGVKVNNDNVSILMYADDVALLAESEDDLQQMLDVMKNWCKTWDVLINTDKSQIVHYRSKNVQETLFQFKLGDHELKKVDRYKYLGLVIDYKLDYSVTAEMVAKSANRALGLLIAKTKCMGGLSFNCFSKLYESSVIPVIRYGASIWGQKEYSCINAVHNRMCRFYLGVGKFTPNAAVQGDIGLRVPWQHQMIEMCRQWCRFINMSNERVNKKVFIWSNSVNVKNWNYRVAQFLGNMDREMYCNIDDELDKDSFIDDMKECTERCYEERWLNIVNKDCSKSKKGKNKLRTYNKFKKNFRSELYVYVIMPKSHRSAYAKFRCGTAPIKLEVGRYEGLDVKDRICPLCHNGVEDEMHVLLECNVYNDIRCELLKDLSVIHSDILTYSKEEILKCVLNCNTDFIVKKCAKACNAILSLRQQLLYT